ncbi:hypothetical protein PV325_010782, partial [Microctonus aethiopoides]
DWETAWAEQLAKRERRLTENGNFSTLKRGSEGNVSSGTHSIHRYMELALIADKKFLEFWTGTNYEFYLLTVMNMVADLYHDASIGNQIDVVLVRIVYLAAEEEEKDLDITPDSERTLDSFAGWAEKINSKYTNHPNHFDVAVLISRHDFCTPEAACGLKGLAYTAGVCDPIKAAAIAEDSGLLSGIIISHEVGHLVGSTHDVVEINGCPFNDTDGSFFVMAAYVDLYTFRWSVCSRRSITNLMNNGLGDCLINNPKNPPAKFQYPNMLPGAMYNSDSQCWMMLPDTVSCDIEELKSCEKLWCRRGMTCISNDAPPAEGTTCGENEWCIRKKCVRMGSRPSAINGGWGEWGSPGECSRTCGGGVRVTERECDNPRPSNLGRYCLGERRRVEVCNSNPCDPDKPSFRATQCSEYDSKQILADGVLHTWKPLVADVLDPCILYCANEHKKFVELGITKDGTACKSGTNNMCISGRCREVGCDWILESGAIEDRCQVCQGDGTQCTFIEGDYNETRGYGYAKVVTIPKSAKGIKVFEKEPSENALAVKLEHYDDYCLNGENEVTYMRELNCVGARLIYKRSESKQDEIEIKGPINDDIQIQ